MFQIDRFKILLLCLVIFLPQSNLALAGNKTAVLDSILHQDVHPSDFIKSSEYQSKRDVIREELIIKLNEIISRDRCDDVLGSLWFVVEISDKKYIKLIKTIENKGPCAGVNLKGYSEFIKSKSEGVSNATIINKLVRPGMGEYLFNHISEHVLSRSRDFEDKLMLFKNLCEKVQYKYRHVIIGTLEELCRENSAKSTAVINRFPEFRQNLEYDCNNINETP